MPEWFRSPNAAPGLGCVLCADDNGAEQDLENTGAEQKRDDRWSFTRRAPPKWSVRVLLRVRAMLLAQDVLFIAGPPDVLAAEDPLAAYEGRGAARILAVSCADGKVRGETSVDAQPVFDGLAVAGARLFLSTTDGRVRCLERRP